MGVDRGQTGEAQEALERAETRLLDRAVGMNSAEARRPTRLLTSVSRARRSQPATALAHSGLSMTHSLHPPWWRAVHRPCRQPLTRWRTLPYHPSPPPVTYALLPGHWQLEGARYIWVPPETALRRVEARPLIEGRSSGATGNGTGCLHIMKTTEMDSHYGAAASPQRRSSWALRD